MTRIGSRNNPATESESTDASPEKTLNMDSQDRQDKDKDEKSCSSCLSMFSVLIWTRKIQVTLPPGFLGSRVLLTTTLGIWIHAGTQEARRERAR